MLTSDGRWFFSLLFKNVPSFCLCISWQSDTNWKSFSKGRTGGMKFILTCNPGGGASHVLPCLEMK